MVIHFLNMHDKMDTNDMITVNLIKVNIKTCHCAWSCTAIPNQTRYLSYNKSR